MAQPPNPYAALTPTEAESSGPFEPETLLPLINRALPLAQALPSQSPLVAVGRGSSGRTFLGVNVELPGLSPLHSIHAGQFLVVHLALNNERTLNCLAFSSNGSYFDPPCPHCCQLLQEIRNASSTKLLITDPSRQRDMSLSTYLPQKYLSLYNEVPKYFFARLLDENRNNGLTLINPNPIRDCLDSEICNHLSCRALKAANRSYAPYSKSPSGVALMDFQGRVYSGWSIESVANPILGAAQAALVDFMTNGGGHEFNNIVRGFLVEKRDAKLSHLATAREILNKVAHFSFILRVLHCHKIQCFFTHESPSMSEKEDFANILKDINSKRRRNIHHGTIYKTGDEKTLKFILGVNYKDMEAVDEPPMRKRKVDELMHAVDPSNDSRFTFQTRVTRATCQKDEDLRILTEVCRIKPKIQGTGEQSDGMTKLLMVSTKAIYLSGYRMIF
ncbi:Cytidine/deoxycytidylate deaminase family protein [Arabidopsis thaliana]|uniref:Cytidine/deoxycytidylate deaminase family protein n=1 Tax=Arabidopsis thaliana TaxID=3702 RepID=F4JNN8_ARATH|nr:Cytidine/deoxycytidylate deaminase family protein [Arabidopsis thaliana]AEE85648.1 Cytidine/deoxycytidylate deaminase family protein [Arabidopsis thaliana]|eukprot:NP_001154274.1 Cytidine/deoxycytidylate deaminase family protein [Arabidopsis thaliana]